MNPKNDMTLSTARDLRDALVSHAKSWVSDLGVYHESSYDFCQFDRVAGPRGPTNQYRYWTANACPGDVLQFEPGHAHHAKGGVEADYKVLSVPAVRVARAMLELTGKPEGMHFDALVARSLYSPVENVHRAVALAEPRIAIEQALETLLIHLVESRSRNGGPKLDSIDDHTVAQARKYIDDSVASTPSNNLTLAALVTAVGAKGKSQLIRDFQRVVGVCPYEYFKLRKFAVARRLLGTRPNMKVAHIAWDLGYTAYSFARSFRDLHGLSPRAYRNAVSQKAR